MTDRPTFVLTVRQPWAWAIIHGGKHVENRTWKPQRPCRVLIHAATQAGFEHHGLDMIRQLRRSRVITVPVPRVWHFGAIIGVVDVTGWDREQASEWAFDGYWHWHLANPVAASPEIPMRGQPSFFRPPPNWQRSFPPLEA